MIQDAARSYGGVLVILNSDEWLTRKKGRPFMRFEARRAIVSALRGVTEVYDSINDLDDGTVCARLQWLTEVYRDHKLTFCNGGDRGAGNTPEADLCRKIGIGVDYGIGGGKTAASSDLIEAARIEQHQDRPWGHWTVRRTLPGLKVKELFVQPGKALSDQRHTERDEFWFVASGSGDVKIGDCDERLPLKNGVGVRIPRNTWHHLRNTGREVLHILEVQRGVCTEEDIQRRD